MIVSGTNHVSRAVLRQGITERGCNQGAVIRKPNGIPTAGIAQLIAHRCSCPMLPCGNLATTYKLRRHQSQLRAPSNFPRVEFLGSNRDRRPPAFDPAHARKLFSAARAFIKKPTRASLNREGQGMSSRFVADSQIPTRLSPFGSMWRDPAPTEPGIERANEPVRVAECGRFHAGSCSCKRGFNEMSLRRESARPAALESLAFHSTCKECASSGAPSASNICRAFLSSSKSRPSTTSDGPRETIEIELFRQRHKLSVFRARVWRTTFDR